MKLIRDQLNGENVLLVQPLEMPEFETALLPDAQQLESGAMKRRPLLVIQHECLGHVDAPIGCVLLAGLLEQFVSLESLPEAVILQGIGVRLAESASPAHDVLKKFISLKVPVLICEESAKCLGVDCKLAGSQLASQREIARHLIANPAIIWL